MEPTHCEEKFLTVMKKIHYQMWRCLIANYLYRIVNEDEKSKIDADIERYSFCKDAADEKRYAGKRFLLDSLLLSGDKTFRSIFYYRCRAHQRLCRLCRIFLPDVMEIELAGDIDGGLRLSHEYMVVRPKKAGKNLHIGAGVVIGVNHGQFPTLGENVTIGAHSTVIGGITVGSNVTIQAGSVVTKDLKSNAIYGGNPAVLLKNIDDTTNMTT